MNKPLGEVYYMRKGAHAVLARKLNALGGHRLLKDHEIPPVLEEPLLTWETDWEDGVLWWRHTEMDPGLWQTVVNYHPDKLATASLLERRVEQAPTKEAPYSDASA